MDAETSLLFDITLMLIVAGICSILMKRVRLPAIIGYLIAGILLGPHIFTEVVVQESTVTIFSSIGIVLLMFYIGLELNLRGLKKVASQALIIVSIEMVLMVVIGYSFGLILGLSTPTAIFLGVTISCASTAVVLGVIKENEHMSGKLTKAVTGILILEDIGLIIILAIAEPIMGISTSNSSMMDSLIMIATFIGITVFGGLALVPRMLNWVDNTSSGETLFLVAAGFGFGLALISTAIGLSEAIGAFLAGIIISQSTCCDKIIHKIEPMKEMFMAIFFISIGLALDPDLMISGLPLALMIAAMFIVGKTLSIWVGCYAANIKSRSGFLIATSMVGMGEFTFVVAKLALDGAVITADLYSSVIGAALITMLLLPSISRFSPRMFDAAVKRMPRRMFRALDRLENTRLEAREGMARSSHIKNEVRKQTLYIVIDFIIIILILLALDLLTFFKSSIVGYLSVDEGVASLILFVIALLLIMPAIVHLIKRTRVISETLASTITNLGKENRERHARTYRFFKNMSSMIAFVLLLAVVFPLLPSVKGLPISPVAIVIGMVVIVWLAWDTINAGYDKVSSALSKSVTDIGEDDISKGSGE